MLGRGNIWRANFASPTALCVSSAFAAPLAPWALADVLCTRRDGAHRDEPRGPDCTPRTSALCAACAASAGRHGHCSARSQRLLPPDALPLSLRARSTTCSWTTTASSSRRARPTAPSRSMTSSRAASVSTSPTSRGARPPPCLAETLCTERSASPERFLHAPPGRLCGLPRRTLLLPRRLCGRRVSSTAAADATLPALLATGTTGRSGRSRGRTRSTGTSWRRARTTGR